MVMRKCHLKRTMNAIVSKELFDVLRGEVNHSPIVGSGCDVFGYALVETQKLLWR